MRIDLHTHTTFSDGELIPSELVRRAMALGHEAIAITDHVDMTNVEFVASSLAKAADLDGDYIRAIPGVEITHVPPRRIAEVAKLARKCGARIVVVHGETVTEPVAPGTNEASANNPDIDILAHPGLISERDAEAAAANGVTLEISGRKGHSLTNGHVAKAARAAGAAMVVNSDAHSPDNLMSEGAARIVAAGAGLEPREIDEAIDAAPRRIIDSL